MSSGYDGSIKIDTSISTTGFNQGLQKMSGGLKGFMNKLTSTLTVMALYGGLVVTIIGVLAAAIGGLIIQIGMWGYKMFQTLRDSISQTGQLHDTVTQLQMAFDNVKGAFMAAFATLLQAAAPIIKIVLDGLIKVINFISLAIAALTGQKTAWQYVAGSASSAAGSAGKMAKETKKAKKEAQGALAAFDQINVLQKKNAEAAAEPTSPATGVGGGGGGGAQFTQVPVPDNFLKTAWENFKQWFHDRIIQPILDFWNNLIGGIGDLINKGAENLRENMIKPIGETFGPIFADIAAWASKAFANISAWASQAFADISAWAIDARDSILNTWNIVSTWFLQNVVEPVKKWFADQWDNVKKWASEAWVNVQNTWKAVSGWFTTYVITPVKNGFSIALENIKGFFSDAWEKAKGIWEGAGTWFTTNVTDPVKSAFGTALDWVHDKFDTILNGPTGIKAFVKNAINSIISLVNGMMRAVASGLNSVIKNLNAIKVDVPSWVPVLGGKSWSLNIPSVSAPTIPLLATGAVIPAHANMLAMLGEGSKREIVAPEDTIRRIVREENQGGQEITIRFTGTMAQFVREMKPEIDKENTRVGTSLIKIKGPAEV